MPSKKGYGKKKVRGFSKAEKKKIIEIASNYDFTGAGIQIAEQQVRMMRGNV